MTSYYCEVGLLSSVSSQEQAPPCISIIPHPCSSQGPGTKSKESLLSRTKLFNAVISCIFFIPPFAIGNETWWKIWCVVLHTNEGPWIFLSFTVMGDRICSATTRNTFSDSWVWDNLFICCISKGEEENPDNWLRWVGLLFHLSSLFDTGDFQSRGESLQKWNTSWCFISPVKQRKNNIFRQHAASATSCFAPIYKSWLILSYQMYVGEKENTARYAIKILSNNRQSDIFFWIWDRNHKALWQKESVLSLCIT